MYVYMTPGWNGGRKLFTVTVLNESFLLFLCIKEFGKNE